MKLRAVYPPFSAAGWPCLPKTFRYELVEETREKLEAAGVEAIFGTMIFSSPHGGVVEIKETPKAVVEAKGEQLFRS